MKKLIILDTNRETLINDDQLIDLLTNVYTLGYLKAWETLSPNSDIYNTEVKNNAKF